MSADLIVGLVLGIVIGVMAMLILGMFNTLKAGAKRDTPRTAPVEPEEPLEEEGTARLIDPLNPPTWRRYAPKSGVAGEAKCVCHDRPFDIGQPVMWWPVVDGIPGQVDLLCEEGLGMDAPVGV